MTIRGWFGLVAGWMLPQVRASLYLPGVSADWSQVDFLLDTGCTHSLLQTEDAITQIGIAPERLQQPVLWRDVVTSLGVGGLSRMYRVPARYSLADDSGRMEIVEGQIHIAQFVSRQQQLPSLLGWDVLKEFDISLNQGAGIVALRRL
jgi:hypothetical protein